MSTAPRKTPVKTKSGSGGRTAKCSCSKNSHLVKESISNGLRLIRTRFSLSRDELPELGPSDLDKYLLFLLGGPDRSPTPFPRSQRGWQDGFPVFVRLSRRNRWMLAQSCASLKRGIPNLVCQKHRPSSSLDSWLLKQCPENPPTSSPEYLRFARSVVRSEFRTGWDEVLYPSFCHTFCPRTSRRADKQRASEYWSGAGNWMRYQNSVLHGRLPNLKGFDFRYSEVPTAGKMRPMGVPTPDWDLLAPLHKSIYGHLERSSWLLVGPPTSKAISRLGSTFSSRFFTSVDLVSATDGLCLDVAEVILGALLAKSVSVPGSVRALAHASLRPTMEGREVTHGQMMGTYLSFPLLCLQSYIAARWATRDQCADYLVNGDDTVICSDHHFVSRSSYPPTFSLNDRKTIRSRNVVEINSTTFLATSGKWSEVVHLRRGAFNSDLDGYRHASVACQKAGQLWVSAYFRCRVGWKMRILPSALGFSMTNHDAFSRESRLKRGRYCPSLPVKEPSDKRYRLVPRDLVTPDEQIAFRIDLFEKGREVEKKEPGRSQLVYVRPQVRFRCPRRFVTFTFDFKRELMIERKEKREMIKKDTLCVPKDYEGRWESPSNIRECGGLLTLTWW